MRLKSLFLAFLVLGAMLIPRTASAALPVIHIPTSTGDLATNIMHLATNYPNGMIVVLTNGTYNTTPYKIIPANYPHFEIIGAGMNTTQIRYKDNSISGHTDGEHHAGISATGYISNFFARDFTIDCNWANQSSSYIGSGYTDGFRLGGISIPCWTAEILRVEVKNAGANGHSSIPCASGGPAGSGMEVFPIQISTLNNDLSFIQIKECLVRDVYSVNGGYCTGIIVGTHLYESNGTYSTSPYQNIAMGARTTPAAEIHDNDVENLANGIAYGCARSEQVDFYNNRCDGAKYAFNTDTGLNKNIWIRNNAFSNIDNGISIGTACHAAQYFTNFIIEDNTFAFNGTSPTPTFIIQFQGSVADVTSEDNQWLSGWYDYEYLVPDGCACSRFYVRFNDYTNFNLNDTGWIFSNLYHINDKNNCPEPACGPFINVKKLSDANEDLGTVGRFEITRSGSLTSSLAVSWTISGSAIPYPQTPVDYVNQITSLTGASFAANVDTIYFEASPYDDSTPEGTETVIMTITSSPNYTRGYYDSATIFLTD